ncbi:MAG: type II secretion system F family protein [Candidatus Staskawiczbacteria bacterium]|nr:type II secretion system F family protein [Candidatus Staskawiczbacteria bacterium]
MRFNYKARSRDGKIEVGSIEAYSKEAAVSLLQKYNIFVTQVDEVSQKKSFFKNISIENKVSKKDLAIFFRQLAVMMESQVPVVQSLQSLAAETKKKSFKKSIADVAKLVEEGIPFSQALLVHADTFSGFYVSLVKSGEASGKIAPALYSISGHLEREYEVSSQVKQALIYPLFLVLVLFFVIGIVVTQIVPKIEDLVRDTGNSLSPFATAMINFYKFIGEYWWFLFLVFFIIFVAIFLYFRTEQGKKEYDNISLKIPFIGDFLKKVFLIRFASNISTLLIAGVSINNALEITKDTVDNDAYKNVISDVEKKVSEGERLSFAMASHSAYFPSFVLQIIRVGEATGKLDKILIDVVSFYEKEIKRSIDLFSRLLEPIMILVLGGIVTMLAISVLSSIYGAIGVI